jgi:hypothetical protein
MLSSISNSEPFFPARRGWWKGLLAFLISFALIAGAGEWVSRQLSFEHAWHGEQVQVPPGGILTETDSDQFPIYDTLYYGLGDAIDNAKKADVLLLGNSRVLSGFREKAVQEASARSGLKFFNLCYPANDGMVMAYQTILKHDLHPKIVIINETNFFNWGISPFGKDTTSLGAWRAWVRVWEDRISWTVRAQLHRFLPRFGWGKTYRVQPPFQYQSVEDGCLCLDNQLSNQKTYTVNDPKLSEDPTAEEIAAAKMFRDEMAKRGTAVVLTDIPFDREPFLRDNENKSSFGALMKLPENSQPFQRADKLAKLLGVPLIAPAVVGLRTTDGSHLDEASGDKFAQAFFQDFLKLSRVKALAVQEKK